VPELIDPFKQQNAANRESIYANSIQIAILCSPVVLFVILLGLAAEKVPAVRSLLTRSGVLQWQVMDLFFGESHFKSLGSVVRIQKTAFGAALSVACLLSMAALSWLLGVSNLLYPQYVVGVSSQPPDWRPHGVFQLSVTVHGLGLESCSSNSSSVRLTSESGAWSSAPSSTASLNADGSCVLVWQCGPKCQMVETASGQTVLKLLSTSQSAASYVSYTLQLPSFTSSALDASSGSPFVLSSSFYAPNTDGVTAGALQGTSATSVNLQLSPYVVASSSGVTQMVAFEPSLTGVQFGDTTSASTFDFRRSVGFEIDFVLSRSTLSFV
jgi:hypothetical protein